MNAIIRCEICDSSTDVQIHISRSAHYTVYPVIIHTLCLCDKCKNELKSEMEVKNECN